MSGQSLFNRIQNCNKSYLWSLRKNIFCCTRSGCASVPPLSAFSDLCCAIGFVSPAVLCPPLHSTDFLLLQPGWCLGKASPSLPPESFPGSSLSKGKWWNCHPGIEPYQLKRAKSPSSNCDKSCETSHGYSRKNQGYSLTPLPDTLSEHIHLCGGLLKISYPSEHHCKAPCF